MKLRTLFCLAAALTFTALATQPASAGLQIFRHHHGYAITPMNVNQPGQDSPENWDDQNPGDNVVVTNPGGNNPGDNNGGDKGGNTHAAPSPAALPAGLMALGFLAARRRRQDERE